MRSLKSRRSIIATGIAYCGLLATTDICTAEPTASERIDQALQNITTLQRPSKVGYATIWDGNKYVQCRRLHDRNMRCEAAGSLMQSSLKSVLTADKINKLTILGWSLEQSFGNYVRTFPADFPTRDVANQIVQVLRDAYAADIANIELSTTWAIDSICPTRNGPSQNLAGIVNDDAAMRATAIITCSYALAEPAPKIAGSAAELIAIYGTQVQAELQRLRVNATRNVWVSFSTGIGYIQCAPETPTTAIYCEAQSAESWPALTAVLTPERISLLRKLGYAEPGRAPNYSKSYPSESANDVTLASELLTILHDAYGYNGATELKILTEH